MAPNTTTTYYESSTIKKINLLYFFIKSSNHDASAMGFMLVTSLLLMPRPKMPAAAYLTKALHVENFD